MISVARGPRPCGLVTRRNAPSLVTRTKTSPGRSFGFAGAWAAFSASRRASSSDSTLVFTTLERSYTESFQVVRPIPSVPALPRSQTSYSRPRDGDRELDGRLLQGFGHGVRFHGDGAVLLVLLGLPAHVLLELSEVDEARAAALGGVGGHCGSAGPRRSAHSFTRFLS